MTNSNQYPRLPWEHNPEPVHGGFMARPHGPGTGLARVYRHRQDVGGHWWVWAVGWPQRFAENGMVSAPTAAGAKQAAADKATLSYWDHMTATEGWAPPAAPQASPADFVAWHFWRRFEDWLWNRATLDEVKAHLGRYLHAVFHGPAIMGNELDRQMWHTLSTAAGNQLNFGFDPGRPPGTRGYFAARRTSP